MKRTKVCIVTFICLFGVVLMTLFAFAIVKTVLHATHIATTQTLSRITYTTSEKPSIPFASHTLSTTDCRATVLVYHHIKEHAQHESAAFHAMTVSPRTLDTQLTYLTQNKYVVISYGDLVRCVQKGIPIPTKSVVLTFDDRWHNQYSNAYPLLLKHNMTATFFIVATADAQGLMSWNELREMKSHGMTIASHTFSHPHLPRCTERSLANELVVSRENIKKNLGEAPDYIAYPFGDYDARVINATKRAGYVSARAVDAGLVHKNLYAMKAVGAVEEMPAFIKALTQ